MPDDIPAACGCGSAATLPLQPRPIKTRTAHLVVGGREVTSIHRRWPPGTAQLCRRCERCSADADDECLLLVRGRVDDALAPGFSTLGLREQWPLARAMGEVRLRRCNRPGVLG